MRHESPELVHVRGLEERAFNAWPALQTVLVDGWVLRFADGYTKRANSVNAWHPAIDAGHIAGIAAPLFAALGLPLVFRLSPLAGTGADADLAARGFTHAGETVVMTAPLARPIQAPLPQAPVPQARASAAAARDPSLRRDDAPVSTAARAIAAGADVTLAARPSAAWLTGFAEANRVPEQHRATLAAMLDGLKVPAAFVTAQSNGVTAGYGMAVAERGMVGLFDIVTVEAARRQGIGQRVVDALLAWGLDQRAATAYLQVVATNAPARRLYESLGFGEAYRYHYRIAPDAKSASN